MKISPSEHFSQTTSIWARVIKFLVPQTGCGFHSMRLGSVFDYFTYGMNEFQLGKKVSVKLHFTYGSMELKKGQKQGMR